ncbi:von Willebrand factor A domain-containing protein 7-like [Asterias rubens]|uniref:von Willebrand factor A domain-containing protein 7-like n=1 Tax=Asterias rubens TaxID=7604 RepID=UPI001455D711|nr:von Willebrand factor A domain-containing protein 7-like [Asterias rubens]
MELPKILFVLVSVLMISGTEAFLPSHAGRSLASADYTLTDITVAGIVRVVARYFEDSDPDRYSPGDLTGLIPLTPSKLYQVHYGGCVYSTKFERAISAILSENVRISKEYAQKAVWHFNGNQINKGNRKMINIRDTLLDNLGKGDKTAPDYDVARLYCGQFLHMAQSFYSNTNWIELNRWLNGVDDEDTITTSSDLGIVSPFTWRQSPGSVDMCQNCDITVSPLDCSDNLRPYVYYITSGYKSGQDKKKPAADPESSWGACSHGGKYDDYRETVAYGGINKETSNPNYSPHHHLHDQSVSTALQATEDFFYHEETGLFKIIGEEKFRKLLNLDVGTSLSFVVDTTASMTDEITAVKQQIIEIVETHATGTCLAPSKYVIAPFNDPFVGPVLVTSNASVCINFIDNLDVVGGADCPEMANGGMELGISNSLDGTIVYVYTDADDKDKDKLSDVLALIKKKKIQMKFLLTGECSGSRRRRAAARVTSSYDIIASVSGGEVYRTDDAGIKNLSRIIEGDLRASKVTITKKSVTVPDDDDMFSVDIPVDSTVLEVLVSIVGDLAGTNVTIVTPKGERGTLSGELGVDVFTQSDEQVVFSIATTTEDTRGEWVVEVQNIGSLAQYRVKVSANSLVDFSFDLLELDESGALYPIDGLPVQGDSLKMRVKVSAPEHVGSVSGVYLLDTTGKETLFTGEVEPIAGITPGQYLADITVPSQPFIAVIRGVDLNGMDFMRTQPSEVQVVQVKVEHVLGSSTIDTIYPGGTAAFSFQLSNSGPSDNLTMSVSVSSEATSTSGVQATVAPEMASLDTNERSEGVVTVTAGDDVSIGTTVKVTLTVRSSLTPVLNFLSVDVTVFEFQNDTDVTDNPDFDDFTNPTCTKLTSSHKCTADQMGSECYNHEWSVKFQATDDRIVTETLLEPALGDGQTLKFERLGLKDKIATYTSTCCCPMLNITVRDGNGNTAYCTVDYYTPVAGVIKLPVCNGPVPFDDSGLSTGAIVGIAVGAVAAAILVVTIIVLLVKSCGGGGHGHRKGMVTPEDRPSTPVVGMQNFKHPHSGVL